MTKVRFRPQQLFHSFLYFHKTAGKPFPSHILSLDAEPLRHFYEMRRRKKAGALPLGPQDAVQKSANGTFAVGARHMDHRKLLLGIAQMGKKQPEILRPVLACKFWYL